MLFLVPVCYSVMTSSCQPHLSRLTATAARTQLVLHIFPPYFCQWCRWLCYRMLLFLCDHRLHNMLLMIMSSVIGAHSQYTLLLSVYLLLYSLVAICTSQLSAYSTLWPATQTQLQQQLIFDIIVHKQLSQHPVDTHCTPYFCNFFNIFLGV